MLLYLEEPQHNITAPFTVAKILMHCLAEQYSSLQMISLDFSEALESTPPELTLTYVDNDRPQNSFHIFAVFCYFVTKRPLPMLILNCNYLSIPRLYVLFHPAVYHISEEEAAGKKYSCLVNCLLYCKQSGLIT